MHATNPSRRPRTSPRGYGHFSPVWPGLAALAIGTALLFPTGCGRGDPDPEPQAQSGLVTKPDELCRPCGQKACSAGLSCTSLDSMSPAPLVCAAHCSLNTDCERFPGREGRCVAASMDSDGRLHPVPVGSPRPDGGYSSFAPCAGGACVCLTSEGYCPHRCVAGKWESCNSLGLEDPDGCEQDLAMPEFCGQCDAEKDCTTMFPHATGRCEKASICTFGEGDCVPGWADCDGLGHNGCETKLSSNENCGACGQKCGVENHVTTVCGPEARCVYQTEVVDGAARLLCEGDWADCQKRKDCEAIQDATERAACMAPVQPAADGAASGCETQLGTMAHCAACGEACASTTEQPHVCEEGSCVASECPVGWVRCGGKCMPLGLDTRCGSCSQNCTVASKSEKAGKCCVQVMTPVDPSVPPSAADCVTLEEMLADAGKDKQKQKEALEALTCHAFECQPGWANCDGSADGSCETDLQNDVERCGECPMSCLAKAAGVKHAVTASCSKGECKFGCEDGYTTCDDAFVCVTKLGTNAHCKECGNKCINGMTCVKGACTCPPEQVACTKNGEVTCRTPGVDFCEVCGDKCLASNACSLVDGNYKCKACDGATAYCIAGQGCVPINTAARCGTCDNNCLAGTPKHVKTDAAGKPAVQCVLGSGTYTCDYDCQDGWEDCDPKSSGCESSLAAWPNCGGCGACDNVEGTSEAARKCQTGTNQAPCGAYLKPPSTPQSQSVTIEDKTVKVTWSSSCKYGYFDCNGEDAAKGLDGCECRTSLPWSTPPAWLLDCSSACKNGSCSCDYNAIKAVVCTDSANKCLD